MEDIMRLPIAVLLLLCCKLAAPASLPAKASADTVVQKSLRQLADASKNIKKAPFRFVVLGDSRPSFLCQLPTEFTQALAETELWKAGFSVALGDLIIGYSYDDAVLHSEWDAQIKGLSSCKVPFFPVAGDHDVYDTSSTAAWQNRLGPLYYSFDYSGSHFISLDSVEQPSTPEDSPAIFSEAQLAWLKKDLDSHRNAANIFVFMHYPAFDSTLFKNTNWPVVHELLKRYPVRAVFAGGIRSYRNYPVRDGIAYIASGRTGAPGGNNPALGEFAHYLLVTVDGSNVSWVVIKPGSILPADVVTNDDYQTRFSQIDRLSKLVSLTPAIERYLGQTVPEDLNLALKNPGSVEMSCTASWQFPPGWRIEPTQTAIRIPAGGQRDVEFSLHLSDPRLLSGRLPELILQFPQSNGSVLPLYMPIAISDAPQICRKITKPLKIDGDLSDWGNTHGLLFRKMHGSKDLIPNDFCAATRLLWDDKWLYVGVEVWDDDIKADGSSELTYNLGDACVELMPDASKIRVSYGDSKGPAADYTAAVNPGVGHVVYELAIPISHVIKSLPLPGSSLSATLNCYDRDGSDTRHWLWESWDVKFE